MSFSKHIETAIGWNNLDDWKPILFRDLTIEPICTPREYGGDEVPERRLSYDRQAFFVNRSDILNLSYGAFKSGLAAATHKHDGY